jgi:hypothetical protein
MSLDTLPLFERLAPYERIMLTGLGGGFDIFAGLPLYFHLRAQGKQVTLGNLSFSRIEMCSNVERLSPTVATITPESDGPEGYFPEKYLAQWFASRGEDVPIYAFEKSGVIPLRAAYEAVIDAHDVQVVVGCDGGTDSLMRGDEPQLGTPEEDMVSLCALAGIERLEDSILACLGFGVDTFHGVCHHYFLEAVAELTASGDFLGAFSCMAQMPEVNLYKEAVEFVHARMPARPSIVNHSILSAIDGEFGDVHRTHRTSGSQLYINPLMALYFAFDLQAVARRVQYMQMLERTTSFPQVTFMIRGHRSSIAHQVRTWKEMPM